jgi:hypothetical protein
MTNSYRLMTLQYGLMMDVTGGVAQAGTPVEVWTANSPPSANQLWTFEPGPAAHPGFFFIKSNLGPNLVLDVTGGVSRAGTPLEVWTQNSPPSANQLWEFAPVLPGAPIAQGFIRSLLAPSLVVDVTGGSRATRGTRLEVWPQNSPASANQLWFLLAAPGNIYHPQISAIVPEGRGFRITGTGLQAGTPVYANYTFYEDTDPSYLETGSFIATTDFGGDFVNDSPITILGESPGVLEIAILISEPWFPHNILALWDGQKFTIQQG